MVELGRRAGDPGVRANGPRATIVGCHDPAEGGAMATRLFAFCGRVSTEDNQEPEASRLRQVAQAQRILPPHSGSSRSTSTSGTVDRCRGPDVRRPPGFLQNSGPAPTSGTRLSSASSPEPSARRSSTRPSTRSSSTSGSSCGFQRSVDGSTSPQRRPRCSSACWAAPRSRSVR